MNIFVLSDSVVQCARYHCDQHVIKMILEHAQMLSTTNRMCGLDEGYKATHQNPPPCTKWVRESLSNWRWLRELTYALEDERHFRWHGRSAHKSIDMVVNRLSVPDLPDIGLTKFAQAMPAELKSDNPIASYRKYYETKDFATWTGRNKPEWLW